MPVKSQAQKRLMLAVEHGWKKPGGGGPSKKVAEDFIAATPKGAKLPERKAPKK
jgi:hypothetical protein